MATPTLHLAVTQGLPRYGTTNKITYMELMYHTVPSWVSEERIIHVNWGWESKTPDQDWLKATSAAIKKKLIGYESTFKFKVSSRSVESEYWMHKSSNELLVLTWNPDVTGEERDRILSLLKVFFERGG